MHGQYIARVSVTVDGKADFKVYETDTLDEYMPAHVYHATGAFVGEIHKECEAVLNRIVKECFFTEHFKWEQSKRILSFIKTTYQAEPEYLWSILPECAALRAPGKKSWFAVVGRIPKEKLGIMEGGIVEVINLKGNPKDVREYIESGMAYPAYHMNKQHWYSLLLNDSLNDETVIDLLLKSYAAVNS